MNEKQYVNAKPNNCRNYENDVIALKTFIILLRIDLFIDFFLSHRTPSQKQHET